MSTTQNAMINLECIIHFLNLKNPICAHTNRIKTCMLWASSEACCRLSPVPKQLAHVGIHKHAGAAHTALPRLPPRTKALPSHWLADGTTSWHLSPALFHVSWVSQTGGHPVWRAQEGPLTGWEGELLKATTKRSEDRQTRLVCITVVLQNNVRLAGRLRERLY